MIFNKIINNGKEVDEKITKELCSDDIWNIINLCKKVNPEDRPSLETILVQFEEFLSIEEKESIYRKKRPTNGIHQSFIIFYYC